VGSRSQVLDEEAVAVPLRNVLRLDDPVAETLGEGDLQGESTLALLAGLGLGHQALVGGETGLAFRLTGFGDIRTHSSSRSISRWRLEACLLFAGQTLLLLFEPRRVVALEGVATTLIEFEDPPGDVVEEVPVVGDGDDRALVVVEEPLEPGHRFGVEVVGRLVEQQQIG
jgi:hypothetical protein